MTETKFTPGPWSVEDDIQMRRIYSSEGYEEIHVGYNINSPSGEIVGCEGITDSEPFNAHLIAAAPELYEALVRMKEWCENDVGAELPCDSINTALAKARGETK